MSRLRRLAHTGDTADMVEDQAGPYMLAAEVEPELERVRADLLGEVRAAARYVDVFEGPRASVREAVEIAIVYALESEEAARELHRCVCQAKASA